MRVLVVSHHVVKGIRGNYDYNLCTHLEQEGIEVHNIALFGDNSHLCKHARILKKTFGFLPRKFGQIFSPELLKELRGPYDIIHLHGAFWSLIPLQAIFWRKLFHINTPMIMTTHAYVPDKQKMLLESIKEGILKIQPKLIFDGIKCLPYRRLDKILCQSNLEREFVINNFKIPEDKVITIPNAVDMNRYKITTYNFKEKNHLNHKYMILFVGQLIPMKGVPYLLKAIKILKDKNLDCDLILVSYNPKNDLQKEIQSLGIEKNVKIFSSMPEKDLISAYYSCDVFAFPSLFEGLPTVLLEAMAAKKPVVTTNVSGIPHLIKNNFNGLMINPRDHITLAEKIEELIKNKELYEKISLNGYNTVLENYTWKAIVKK